MWTSLGYDINGCLLSHIRYDSTLRKMKSIQFVFQQAMNMKKNTNLARRFDLLLINLHRRLTSDQPKITHPYIDRQNKIKHNYMLRELWQLHQLHTSDLFILIQIIQRYRPFPRRKMNNFSMG